MTASSHFLTELFDSIANELTQLDHLIEQRLRSDVVLINQVAEYITRSRGKRLRPALLFLVAAALGGPAEPTDLRRTELAAVIELIHTATLLHDDVVDESDLRRGKKTVNAFFGNAASVLTGDFLYSRAFQMMSDMGQLHIMRILSDATNVIAEGEVLQLLNMHNAHVGEAGYMQVVYRKTAKLFEAAAQLGAVLAKANADTEKAAAEFGRHIGVAFQIMDDWLDYAGDAQLTGKPTGCDLREGKPTLPLIYLLTEGTPRQCALAQHAIEQGGGPFNATLEALKASGALDRTLKRAKEASLAAASVLHAFPESIYKKRLLELCAYSTERFC